MPVRIPVPALLAAAVAVGTVMPAWAEDPADNLPAGAASVESSAPDFTPRPARVITDKPRIEDYADYNAFLVDIMEYRRQKQERLKLKEQAAAGAPAAAATATGALPLGDAALASVSGQDATSLRELYEIEAPETLEEALTRAAKLPHPRYEEAERFGRTTSFSFPIVPMDVADLSVGAVEGRLQDLQTLTPEVYEELGSELTALEAIDDNENKDGEEKNAKAGVGALLSFRVSVDMAQRVVRDLDGRKFWMPIFVENKDLPESPTIIKSLDFEVRTSQ